MQDNFDEFKKVMNDDHQALKGAEFTEDELRILKAIRDMQNKLAYDAGPYFGSPPHRQVLSTLTTPDSWYIRYGHDVARWREIYRLRVPVSEAAAEGL